MPPAVLAATIIGGAGLAGAAISGSAAKSAASQQVTAEQKASDVMQQQYQQTRSDLLPYNITGQQANEAITGMGPFAFAPTQAQLEATPGYQFNLSQGLKATQNGYAAQGLGTSGAALKGAAAYASGLADTTYQNQFTNALNSYQTNLQKLQTQANLGENAAANTGSFGTTTAGNIGQTAVGAANAGAAGTVGVANAATGALNSGVNAYLYNSFFNPQTSNPVTAGGGTGMYNLEALPTLPGTR